MAVTLQQIKDEYAKEEWPDNWEAMSRAMDFPAINEIAKRYAEECCKATLEKARNNIKSSVNSSYGSDYRWGYYCAEETIKISLTNPSNIVLL